MDLSILIPAKNEEFLGVTIKNVLENIRGNTEIIAVLDGYETKVPEIPSDPRLTVIVNHKSLGQRGATNQACKLSEAKYIMKLDAHCAVDEGFDVKLMADMQDDWTVVPLMKNLHAFDWVCEDGHRRYQGKSGPCEECGKETTKDIKWIGKSSPNSTAMRFDKDLKFQYWGEYKKQQKGQLVETMSILGACFMLTREKYWELEICGEEHGSWGQQGTEVACKTWLSGGKLICNKNTWFAHMFRTQGGDFGFPYQHAEGAITKARSYSKHLWLENNWDKAIHPLSWLLDKFGPVPGWENKDVEALRIAPTKGILYYTDNRLNMRLAGKVRKQIEKSGLPITSVSLKPTGFGKNIVIKRKRGYLTMFKQILAGLEAMTENIVYFCEHDVLYHPSHFEFTPEDPYKFYYNGNYWFLRKKDGFAINYDATPLSGLVGYREQLITHFKERVALVESLGDDYKPLNMGFEPMTHGRVKWKNWFNYEVFMPEGPNIDITHENNTTWKRWDQKDFRKKPKFWNESTIDNIPGWENINGLV